MAHAVLWLLLSLLLPGVPLGDGLETLELQIPSQVFSLLGKKVKLPCQLQGVEPGTEITQLTWELQKSGEGTPQVVAVFHPTKGSQVKDSEDPNNPQRIEFEAAKFGGDLTDASLIVSEVRREDEGTYWCHISTFPQGSASGKTELHVRALPQNKVEPQETSLDPTPRNLVPVAQCISEGGWPPPQVSWLLGDLGGSNETKEQEEQKPGPLPGTVTVTSVLMVLPSGHMNGKNVTCKVEHETLEKPNLLPIRLSVFYLPEVSISGYDGIWYVGRRTVALTCEVDSNPEDVNVAWNTTKGTLPLSAEAQGRQLLISAVDESVNTTFICLATNAVGTGQAELTIQLKEPPPREHLGHIIAIVIVVLVIFFGGGLIYCYCRRCCGYSRSSSLTNGANGTNGVNRANGASRVNRVNGTLYSVVSDRSAF